MSAYFIHGHCFIFKKLDGLWPAVRTAANQVSGVLRSAQSLQMCAENSESFVVADNRPITADVASKDGIFKECACQDV